jgi:hypothetical protein
MATSALSAVSAAVFKLLQDLAAAGGVHEDLPQSPTLPIVLYEVQQRDIRGFGTGALLELELRTHVYSRAVGRREGQDLDALVIGRLKDQALPVAGGFTQCGLVFYDDTLQVPDEELNGVKVHETLSRFRIYVEAP